MPALCGRSPRRLNPFENQVYFHGEHCSDADDGEYLVLIPLRIRSISTLADAISNAGIKLSES